MEINWQIHPDDHAVPMRVAAGLPITYDSKFKDRSTFSVLKNTFSELPDLKSIRRYIDIGCSYGWSVPLVYDICENIECFEIRSDVFEYLNLNMKNNNFSNKVNTYNFGISDVNGKAYHNSGFGNPKRLWWGGTRISRKGTECKVATLDSFNFKDVDLIKIDVEGHEYKALQGAKNTIEYNRPIIITEIQWLFLSDSNKKFMEFFDTLDYYIYWIDNEDVIFVPMELEL